MQPKFLSKKQREELALKRLQEEAAAKKQRCGETCFENHSAVGWERMLEIGNVALERQASCAACSWL